MMWTEVEELTSADYRKMEEMQQQGWVVIAVTPLDMGNGFLYALGKAVKDA